MLLFNSKFGMILQDRLEDSQCLIHLFKLLCQQLVLLGKFGCVLHRFCERVIGSVPKVLLDRIAQRPEHLPTNHGSSINHAFRGNFSIRFKDNLEQVDEQ